MAFGRFAGEDPSGMAGCVRAAAVAAVAALAVAAAASADSRLIVGVDDDWLKWSGSPDRVVKAYEELYIGAVRVTLRWQPGEAALDSLSRLYLHRVVTAAPGTVRVVLAVYGRADQAPAGASARADYCSFVADALRFAPGISDVVIWNEANSPRFWRPQQGAAAAYEALLAECYDELHALRKRLNVISSTAPHRDPGAFIAALGAAYRASGRRERIFDSFGHDAYPNRNDESPLAVHTGSRSLDEGDYEQLTARLAHAFGGTAQPVPGSANVRIWYLEDGFETAVPPEKRAAYTGREVAGSLVEAAPAPGGRARSLRDQAAQLRDAIELAYCQPAVGAFFNFELVDERRLSGWQSGVFWADWTRKPSFATFAAAINDVLAQQIDCSRFPASVR
jgi:hypothetical protein